MAGELEALAKIRAELDTVTAERRAVSVEIKRARTGLDRLTREGGLQRDRRPLERQLAEAQRSVGALDIRADELRERIDRLREVLRLRRPEDSVEALDGQVPVAMLPVRLETRFMNDATELRIRIYPEQIHIDAHEPALTDGELAVATEYWKARWAAATTDERSAAWSELARRVRPSRARFLVAATEPVNLDEIGTGEPKFPDDVPMRPGAFTRQPTARLLPEQWVAIGFRGGTEVVRVWGRAVTEGIAVGLAPDPDDPGDAAEVPDEQDELPIDDTIRWLVDYDAALAAGMAITIRQADLDAGRLSQGFDELVVLGVDWGADPAAAAASIDEQLRRHAFSDGLALLGPGVPTNNTDESRAAPGTDPTLDGGDFDPALPAAVGDAAARLGAALGADPAAALAGAPARGSLDDDAAADMNNVLWASTLGSFLDQMMDPIVSSRTADDVHDHFRRYVRGQGPYAALRVGRQPYGVLPVAAGDFDTGDDFLDALTDRLSGLRTFWDLAVDEVPRLGDSDRPDTDALELLRRTPRSSSFRFREALAASVASSTAGFDLAARIQEVVSNIVLSLAGISGRPTISGITLDPSQRDVPVPLVAYGDLSETDPLDPDYISAVLAASSTSGGFRRLLSEPDEARTLLEALLRHSAALEYVIGSALLVLDHELTTQAISELPSYMRVRDREVFGISAELIAGPDSDAADVSMIATAESPVALANSTVRAIAGNRTLANHLAVATNAELRRRVITRRFAAFRASLERLAKLPTAELDRLAGSTLDCVSHRLDAWITSAAVRRLDEVREQRGSGTYIGGFGYVEDLRPSGAPVSRGYLHAPSIGHAATAAVLRSGHLARGESPDGALAIDLTSTRVSRALDLVEGMRRGQTIGALLGYRFERSVRDRRITLAKYILPIRQRTPVAELATGPDPGAPVESIVARDVVDGVELLDAWRDDPSAYYASLSIPVPNTDRGDLNGLLRELDDLYDAVSDVLVAESVHQAVVGNAERSAAALDALDRQQPLPDLGVVKTPRTATGLAHRLLVVFGDPDAAPGWTVDDPRRAADPYVDRWCGLVLGAPDRFRLAAEVLDADDQVLETLTIRLTDLELSALSVVMASGAAGTDASELEQRLAVRFGQLVTAADAAQIVLLDDPPANSGVTALGLRDLRELATQIGDLLASGRHADARTLLPDTERPAAGVDDVELRARADAAVAALDSAVTALEAIDESSDVDDVVAALGAAATAGVPGAVPGGEPPVEHAVRLAPMARAALDRIAAAEAAFTRVADEHAANAAHDLARIRAVFGENFPVVARFTLPGPAGPELEDFRASLAASAADGDLLGDDAPAVAAWLDLHSTVRPSVQRLTGVLEGAEMLGGRVGLADTHVAQLPHRPGAAWIGLPFGAVPPPTTSWVLHAESLPSFDQPMSALVIDQWTEAVPSTTETTGVSFHFDAPGARAPQTVLVATPADQGAKKWSVSTLAATVREAMALAGIRPLDIDDIDVAARFVPATYLPFNLEAQTPSLNLNAIIATAVLELNEEFTRINT